jgi:ABC-type transport system substrate-binding protein
MPEEIPSDKTSISFFSWKQFWQFCRIEEKIALCFFLIVGLISGLQLAANYRQDQTETLPAFGGSYREGVVGQPRFLNPLYSPANDPDQDIIELVFSGLMKYDGKGNLIPDLAESYQISEDGKCYLFRLRENLFWHDHEPLTVDDVIFTIRTIQNPDYRSPLRAGWLGVELEKLSDREINITLETPYASFLETATTKIIPRHIWKETPALTFPLAVSSTLSFIGSGPYRFQNLNLDNQKQVQSLDLEFFDRYYLDDLPYIAQVSFRFYQDQEALLKGAQRGEIDGFTITDPNNLEIDSLNFSAQRLSMPRYFSVFFNPGESQLLATGAVRRALNYAIDKEKLVEQIAPDRSQAIDSPILPEFYGFSSPEIKYDYDPIKAADILEELGYKMNEETGYREKAPTVQSEIFKSDLKVGSQGNEVRSLQECLAEFPDIYPEGEATGYFGNKTKEAVIKFQEAYSEEILDPWGFTEGTGLVSRTTRNKLNEVCFATEKKSNLLEFTLTTIEQTHLIRLAQALKQQWKEIGVKVVIEYWPAAELENEVISSRNYQALLIGQVLTSIPDPLPFWHSSRKREPGVNLALYESKEADKLLEEARAIVSLAQKKSLLEEFQDLLINDCPAVFLYQFDYIHFVSKNIQGYETTKVVSPAKRFSNISNWYLRTRRAWVD